MFFYQTSQILLLYNLARKKMVIASFVDVENETISQSASIYSTSIVVVSVEMEVS